MIVDLLICTSQKVLDHKIRDLHDPDLEVFWTFKHRPKKLGIESKIWFAIKGEVQGCFTIRRIEGEVVEDWRAGPQLPARLPIDSNIIEDIHGKKWEGTHVFFEIWIPWHELLSGTHPPKIIPSQGFRYIYPGDLGYGTLQEEKA